MADLLDIASDREQIVRDNAIENIQQQPPAALSTGYCHECGKEVTGDLRWCDRYCRDDWQRWNPGA